MQKQTLGEFEQVVLLATLQLGQDAHAPAIGRKLEATAGRRVSRGALYATLERLENKGLLRWEIGAATSERRGHRKRRFEVTPQGVAVLRQARAVLEALWEGLGELSAESVR